MNKELITKEEKINAILELIDYIYIDWDLIFSRNRVSSDFYRVFIHKANIPLIIECNNMSETKLKELLPYIQESKLNQENIWRSIGRYQDMSINFLIEFENKINLVDLALNNRVSNETKEKFFNYLKLKG
jgi:hypothetical protein